MDTSNLQDVDTFKDIPPKSNLDRYDIGLYSFVNHSSHFFLGATASGKEVDIDCPPALAFASLEGTKATFLVPHEEDLKGEQFQVHPLGTAELKDILEAECVAEAIDDTAYDLTANFSIRSVNKKWYTLHTYLFPSTPPHRNKIDSTISAAKSSLRT